MKYLTWLRPFFYYLNLAKCKHRLRIVDSIHDIEFNGIMLWVTDIENTLVKRGVYELDEDTLNIFKKACYKGVRFVVLLTNKKYKPKKHSGDFSRMVLQLEALGFEGVYLQQPGTGWWPPQAFNKWPRKPYRTCFRQALKLGTSELHSWEYGASDILATGDKLRFDVLRPLRMGWHVALVNPLGTDGKGDKIVQIRNIENLTLRLWGMERANQGGVS